MGRQELKKLLEEKKLIKDKIFSKFWPKVSSKVPLLVIFASKDKELEKLLQQVLEGLLVLPAQVAIIHSNDSIETFRPGEGKFIWIQEKADSEKQIGHWITASDMTLIFDEHQDLIRKLFLKGVIPIGFEKSPLLANYHPNEETGNSFTFHSLNPWDIFSALVRAHETYRFPYDWQHILRNTLEVR